MLEATGAHRSPEGLVLIVDDEPLVRRAIGRVVRRAGYRVVSCGDGRSALEAIEGRAPELVVLDLDMPDVDGWAVLRSLHRRPRPPRVVILSSCEHRQRAQRFPFVSDVVGKPANPADLLAAIGEALATAR